MTTGAATLGVESTRWGVPSWIPDLLLLPLTAIGLQLGTGGEATSNYYRVRGAMGYRLAQYDVADPFGRKVDQPAPAENLERILSVLGPTTVELARALKVSRQAIYDWRSGASITAENAARLTDLARAADVFAAEGLTTTHQILRRQIAGRSFFDRVREGESAEDAARLLLKVTRRELEQRRALADRLKGRPSRVLSLDDIGTPYASEQG